MGHIKRSLIYKPGLHSNFHQNTDAEIWYHFFRKWGSVCPLQRKGMLNETSSPEKQFKHIFGVRVSEESPKIGLKFKNTSGLKILRYSYKKVCI